MKSSGHISAFTRTLFITFILFFGYCFSEEASQSYSNILKEAVQEAGRFRGGYQLLGTDMGMESRAGLPIYRHVKELEEIEAVPFLLNVIENGPDWSTDKESRRFIQDVYIARCYAILCLASTEDPRAYSILTDIVQNGINVSDSEINPTMTKKHDARAYAAFGLGVFGDPNSREVLVDELESESSQVRVQSFLALARLRDMRAIKPMMEKTSSDPAVDQFTFDAGMRAITQVSFAKESFFNEGENAVQFNDFPELGKIQIDQEPLKKLWKHWYKIGPQWTKQQFKSKYDDWKETKNKHPQKGSVLNQKEQKLSQLGVAALPLLIEKIDAGDTELIVVVSKLTHGDVERTATKQEVLLWWQNNKDTWTVF